MYCTLFYSICIFVISKAEEKPVSNNVGELPSARNSVTKTNGDPSQAAQPLSSSLSSLGSSQSAASTVSMRSTPEHSAGVGGEAAATASAAARPSTLPHSNSSIRAAAPCTRYASERRANGGATPSSRKSSASRSSSRKKSSSPPAQVELLARANSAEPNAVAPAPQLPPAKPGEIDNSDLIVPPAKNVSCLSTDGLMLKPGLQAGFSYVPVPESLWRALERLYGAKQTLPRYVSLGYSYCLLVIRGSMRRMHRCTLSTGGGQGEGGRAGARALPSAPLYRAARESARQRRERALLPTEHTVCRPRRYRRRRLLRLRVSVRAADASGAGAH